MNKKYVFVAMSGGVDSSVAAALLKKEGYKVIGAHIRCYNVDGCAEQDAEDARRAAEVLDIPFYVFDFEKEYKDKVVNYMIDGYRKGITPNPDVMCNKEIKFGLFFQKAMEMGADYVATGHYARKRDPKLRIHANLQRRNNDFVDSDKFVGSYRLLEAKDNNKDQSYFLWTLTQDQLKHCLFPIGEYKKPRVRGLAAKFGLLNAAKKDSQGICFLGQISLTDFLKRYIKPKKGLVVMASDPHQSLRSANWRSGNLTLKPVAIGTHNGAHLYTIGQRHIGIANRRLTRTERKTTRTNNIQPLYVVNKNIKTNTLIVAEGDNHPALYKKEIQLANVNFLNALPSTIRALPVFARVRYRQPLVKAKLCRYPYSRELENRWKQNKKLSNGWRLVFTKPIKFVAPGQSAVFYRARRSPGKGGRCHEMLGGGIIKSAK